LVIASVAVRRNKRPLMPPEAELNAEAPARAPLKPR
jgi:hypothetical protein